MGVTKVPKEGNKNQGNKNKGNLKVTCKGKGMVYKGAYKGQGPRLGYGIPHTPQAHGIGE